MYTVEVKDADKYRVETNRFGANWFAGIGAGAQMYFGDHDKQMRFVDRITPTSKLTSVSGSPLVLVSVLVLMAIRSRVFLVGRVTTSLLPLTSTAVTTVASSRMESATRTGRFTSTLT